MATGAEHFREAERLALAAKVADLPYGHLGYTHTIALAQVHATLALAAATALMARTETCWSDKDGDAWARVASEQPPFELRNGTK